MRTGQRYIPVWLSSSQHLTPPPLSYFSLPLSWRLSVFGFGAHFPCLSSWCRTSLKFIYLDFFFLLSFCFDSAVSSQIPNRLSKSRLKAKVQLLCPEQEKETEMWRQTKGETDALREFPSIAQHQSVRNICRERLAKPSWNENWVCVHLECDACVEFSTLFYQLPTETHKKAINVLKAFFCMITLSN